MKRYRGREAYFFAFLLCLSQAVAAPESGTTAEGVSTPFEGPNYPRWNFGVANTFYAYNGENTAWETTRVTLTYLDDLVEPFVQFRTSDALGFKIGVGALVGMNQEAKVKEYYPFLQTKLSFPHWTADFGSLDGHHDFPAPILDPLTNVVAQLRTNGSDQVPVHYESFPRTGEYTHGVYEYGASLRWFDVNQRGELYINWQLPDTTNHRERFDIGITHREATSDLPLYFSAHYWHNGGHENPHLIPITENYTAALGLREDTYSVLLLGSLFLPDRQGVPNVKIAGTALYADFTLRSGSWAVTPSLFLSDEFRNHANHYFAVEGDPFFRAPFYVGLNFEKIWKWFEGCELRMGFVNGLFQRSVNEKFNPTQLRYDQMVHFTFRYLFGKENG